MFDLRSCSCRKALRRNTVSLRSFTSGPMTPCTLKVANFTHDSQSLALTARRSTQCSNTTFTKKRLLRLEEQSHWCCVTKIMLRASPARKRLCCAREGVDKSVVCSCWCYDRAQSSLLLTKRMDKVQEQSSPSLPGGDDCRVVVECLLY